MFTFIATACIAECEVTYNTFLQVDAEIFDNTGIFCLQRTNDADEEELIDTVFTSVQSATDYINADCEAFNLFNNVTVTQMHVS
jgi:hypothetical protein